MARGIRAARTSGLAFLAALCAAVPAAADTPSCAPHCAPPTAPNVINALTPTLSSTALQSMTSGLDNHFNSMWFEMNFAARTLQTGLSIIELQNALQQAQVKMMQLEAEENRSLSQQLLDQIRLQAEKEALQLQINGLQLQIMTLQQGSSVSSQHGSMGSSNAGSKGLHFAPTGNAVPDNSPWRDPAVARALGYAGSPGLLGTPSVTSPLSPWSAWTETTYSGFTRSGPASTSGHAGVVTGGLDYRVSQPLIVGVMLGYEDQKFDTTFNGGYLRGSGPTVAPYASWQVFAPVTLNVSAGRGFLDYSMSDGSGVGNYDARRDFVSASLVGNWQSGPWRFTPRANYYYARENHDAYTDSNGAAVGASTIKVGQASAGPEVGYSIIAPGGAWVAEPFAFGALDCNTINQPGIIGINGIVVTDSKCGGRAGGGVKGTAGTLSGLVGASYNSIGRSDQSAWSLQAVIQMRF